MIASLTRSNKNGDIGFLISTERLNVLLSRARKALVIIGNSQTFLASRRGKSTWRPFFDILAEKNIILEGLPARCERHPDRQVYLTTPAEFDELCPDGGCSEPCGVKLSCGVHECPQKCHPNLDHTKVKCQHELSDQCPKKHLLTWKCSTTRPASCPKCDKEARAAEERVQRDAELDKIRQEKQQAYAAELAAGQAEIDHYRNLMRDERLAQDHAKALRQQEKDIDAARKQAERQTQLSEVTTTAKKTQPHSIQTRRNSSTSGDAPPNPGSGSSAGGDGSQSPTGSPRSNNKPAIPSSNARIEWEHEKAQEGSRNSELDELMSMIGLESVKEAFLEIKAKVDLAVRQGITLEKERFGVSFLGNPGTGK